MNIKITHNWLLEYIDTEATPYDIQKYLSLCGPSVESVTKIGNDYVYEIEITSNRVDTASVYGIAREATAILNRFGFKTTLKKPQIASSSFDKTSESEVKLRISRNDIALNIKDDKKLCKRILAIVLDNVSVKPTPKYISERLEAVGIRSLNNLVDITNYIMVEIGHPTHVFDYDRIKTHQLILRQAQDKEEIITLDNKKYNLCPQDIIIDDGTGQVIDLPGIMGTANSVVTANTKKIIFFIESNDAKAIRQSSMKYGIRTMAATINDKSPDPETAKLALLRGIELYQKLTGAKIASQLIDIYPNPIPPKKVNISFADIDRIIGIKIPEKDILKFLSDLEFNYHRDHDRKSMVTLDVPPYRRNDINIKEDIIEEVARIYGYHNLPSILQQPAYVAQPKEDEKLFEYQTKIKYFLKHLGLNEIMNYSMISKKMILDFDLDPQEHLRVTNSLSADIEFLRTHLTPSFVKNIKENEGKTKEIKIFEVAKTYKIIKGQLPEEKFKLGICVNTNYFELKGIIDALLAELNIENYEIIKGESGIFAKDIQGKIFVGKTKLGEFGKLNAKYQNKAELKSEVFFVVFDFETLINNAKLLSPYKKSNPYSVIKLDLTIDTNPKKTFLKLKKEAFATSKLLQKIELISIYKGKLSLRFYFNSANENITEEEGLIELEKIRNKII